MLFETGVTDGECAVAVPAQLPATVEGFAGRQAQIARHQTCHAWAVTTWHTHWRVDLPDR
jgi:hypothetical protein